MSPVVAEVTVEPAGPGALRVRWQLLGGRAAVDVAIGPTPEAIDHQHAERVPAGRTETVLAGRGPGRHYVSVSPSGGGGTVVASERRVPFEGVTNFRDLGGYAVAGGGHTRWGLVFRADALHLLTPADLVAFEGLGLRAVYDLRGDDERASRPNPVPSVALPVIGQGAATGGGPVAELDRTALVAVEDGHRFLRDLYVGMLDQSGPVFGRLLGGLMGDEGTPAVFHCAGGKDRTGMSAALLLLVLGVDRETVLDDYELTARYRTRDRQQGSFETLLATGMSAEAAAGVLASPRHAMADALDVLHERYGGAEAYLTGPGGLQPSTVDALRDTLVS